MRFTSLTTPLLLLLLPLLASADGPPSCTLSCAHDSLKSTSCPGDQEEMARRMGDHLDCLCKDKEYLEACDTCIASSGKCEDAEDVQAAREALETTCKGRYE